MNDKPTRERSTEEILETSARSDIEATNDPQAEDEAMGMAYTSDDPDRQRDGVHETPISEGYEQIALRDELARKLESVVADAADWARESREDDAQQIYDDLRDIYDRIAEPLEETDDQAALGQADEERVIGKV